MNIWDMWGAMAYTQLFALVESLVLALLLVIAAFILPGRLLRNDLVLSSAVIMFVLAGWILILDSFNLISERNYLALAGWFVSLLVFLGISLWLSKRWKALQLSIDQLVGRFSVLAAVYLIVDAISIMTIVIRNINL